jgi:sucrose phosphorylase
LELPSDQTTFFNFLASHDGIGLRPARDLLDKKSRQRLLDWTLAHDGGISYRRVGDEQREPYELNITLFDMLADEGGGSIPSALWINRYIVAQAIMLALQGVPGIYFHSLFGGRNYIHGVVETGMKRTINREKFSFNTLDQRLLDPELYSTTIFSRYGELLRARQSHSAFDPYGAQEVLDVHPSIFSLIRISPEDGSQVLCLHNVTASEIELGAHNMKTSHRTGTDLINRELVDLHTLELFPYQCRWIALDPIK